ncbi:MAG: hypothetical protein JRC77_05965 [Deltaproteobacteria bacterium]|nr:hypothetical protein [Deltaproteobacteria bacterium]
MKLIIDAADINTVDDDDQDTSVATFISGGDYLSIQACKYLEDDPLLNEPYVEYCGQENGQYGGIERLVLHPSKIEIDFDAKNVFMGKYKNIVIAMNLAVKRELVDFLVNHLFLSKYIEFSEAFDSGNIVRQTVVRDEL